MSLRISQAFGSSVMVSGLGFSCGMKRVFPKAKCSGKMFSGESESYLLVAETVTALLERSLRIRIKYLVNIHTVRPTDFTS